MTDLEKLEAAEKIINRSLIKINIMPLIDKNDKPLSLEEYAKKLFDIGTDCKKDYKKISMRLKQLIK